MHSTTTWKVLVAGASAMVVGCLTTPADIITIDFDANPTGYTYGVGEWFGYGSASSGGNQSEGSWNDPSSALTSSATQTGGSGVSGTAGFQIDVDSSNLQAAAIADANARFGDTSVDYTYWGGSFGFGGDPADVLTSTLSEIIVSLQISVSGLVSAGPSLRLEPEFQGGPNGALRFQYDIPLDPAVTGFFTFSAPLSDFGVTLGDAVNITDEYTNLNIGLSLQDAQGRFGLDADNQVVLDNLSVTVIPEPATAMLVLLGLGLGWARRRR